LLKNCETEKPFSKDISPSSSHCMNAIHSLGILLKGQII
jgi:hypothetical protein